MGYNLLGILWELWDSCDGYTGISGDMIWDTGILQYMITVIMNNETYYMTFLLDIVGVFCIFVGYSNINNQQTQGQFWWDMLWDSCMTGILYVIGPIGYVMGYRIGSILYQFDIWYMGLFEHRGWS